MKPHIYMWGGFWWVTRNGPRNWQRGLTLNDACCSSFVAASLCAESWKRGGS